MCVCCCDVGDASTLQVVTTIANLGGIDQFVNPSNITMISVRALRGEIVAERSSCALLWTQVNGHNMTLTQASYLITAMDFTNCIVFMLFICALQASCKRHVRFLCLSLYLSCVAFLSLSLLNSLVGGRGWYGYAPRDIALTAAAAPARVLRESNQLCRGGG